MHCTTAASLEMSDEPELYPAEAGSSSLCDFGIALHVGSSSMQWQDIVDSLLRFVFRREHHVPHHFLTGVEGCRHTDEASLLPPHHDDSWWCHSPRVDGLHSRHHCQHVPRLPHPPHLLRSHCRLRRHEEELGGQAVPSRIT